VATLDDIKSVLEGIRSDLGSGTGSTSGGTPLSAADLADHAQALRDNTAATEELGRETERSTTRMRDMDETTREADGTLQKLARNIKHVGSSMLSMQGSLNMMVDGLIKIGKGLVQVAKKSLDATNKLNELTTGMRAQTGASDALVNSIGKVYDRTLMMGVSLEEAASATNTLMHGMSDFTKITEDQQEALVRDSATLQEIGVSFEAFSSIVETGTKLLGMGASESADMVYKLRGASRDMGIPLDTMMQKLPQLTDKLADMGDQTFQTAIDMMKLNKETGASLDAISQLDSQMYSFEGATKFAAGMNQALQGTFFNPHELMQAYDEGAPAVAKLIATTFNDAGKDIGSMGRRELKFFADRAGIGVADFKKLLGNEMGTLDSEMGKTATDRAAAEADASYGMKSQVDQMKNFKKAFEELPVAAVEEKVRQIQNHLGPAALDTAKMARDFEIVGAEANAIEGALAATAANAATVAKEGASGEIIGGIGLFIAGMARSIPSLIVKIPAFFMSVMGGISSMISAVYYAIWAGMVDFFALSTGAMAGAIAAVATFVYGTYNAITDVHGAIFEVIAAGGDWVDQMIAAPIAIMHGFGRALDFILSGFGLFEEGFLSWISRMFNPGGKSFLEAYLEIDWGHMSEGMDESLIAIAKNLEEFGYEFADLFARPISWIKDQWGSMVGWFATTFATLGPEIESVMNDMIAEMPAPIRYAINNAGKLGDLASGAATAASESYDGLIEALTGKDAEQNITVVQELDGEPMKKTILKVVGGVVQPLTQ
jgi:hypothetical protein